MLKAGEWTNKKPADTGEQQRVGGVMNPAHRRGVKKTHTAYWSGMQNATDYPRGLLRGAGHDGGKFGGCHRD